MPQVEDKKKKISSRDTQPKSGWQFRMPHKYVVYDKLHRGTVFVLVTLTFVGMVRIGMDAFHHLRVRRPILLEKARYDKEAEMEAMQAEREEKLSRQRQLQEEANKV